MRFLLLIAVALAGCGKPPVTAHGKPASVWHEALKDADPLKRQKAVKALGTLGTTDPVALAAVIGALKDADARVRAEAVLACLYIGPAAKEAAGTLEEMRERDPDAKVRDYAGKAAEQVRGKQR